MKPILFNTEMVKAILDGRKTVTRRVVKPQPEHHYDDNCTKPGYFDTGGNAWACRQCGGEIAPFTGNSRMKAPYQIGDAIYVRETFAVGKVDCGEEPDGSDVLYISQCDGENDIIPKEWAIRNEIGFEDVVWKPSIFMPKEAARIFLKVMDVRVERLQDISDEQSEKEGCVKIQYKPATGKFGDDDMEEDEISAGEVFAGLWNSTIKKKDLKEYSWLANPLVWVIEFMRWENAI